MPSGFSTAAMAPELTISCSADSELGKKVNQVLLVFEIAFGSGQFGSGEQSESCYNKSIAATSVKTLRLLLGEDVVHATYV